MSGRMRKSVHDIHCTIQYLTAQYQVYIRKISMSYLSDSLTEVGLEYHLKSVEGDVRADEGERAGELAHRVRVNRHPPRTRLRSPTPRRCSWIASL